MDELTWVTWAEESCSLPETGSLRLSGIEYLARGLAGQAHVPTIGAALQGIPRELSHECQWSSEAGMGTQQSSYYPSQSAKTLPKEFFEVNPPTHLDPSHQTTCLSSGQIQFARAVGLQVALASYGLLEELLVESEIGNRGSVGPAVGGRSPYPSQCGSTLEESSASRSQYSHATIREGIEESAEQFGCLATSNNLFAGIDVPVSQGTTGITQSSGRDGSLTLQQVRGKSQPQVKLHKKTYKLSRPGRPNPIPGSKTEKEGR